MAAHQALFILLMLAAKEVAAGRTLEEAAPPTAAEKLTACKARLATAQDSLASCKLRLKEASPQPAAAAAAAATSATSVSAVHASRKCPQLGGPTGGVVLFTVHSRKESIGIQDSSWTERECMLPQGQVHMFPTLI